MSAVTTPVSFEIALMEVTIAFGQGCTPLRPTPETLAVARRDYERRLRDNMDRWDEIRPAVLAWAYGVGVAAYEAVTDPRTFTVEPVQYRAGCKAMREQKQLCPFTPSCTESHVHVLDGDRVCILCGLPEPPPPPNVKLRKP